MHTAFQQLQARARFDWGLPGALAVAEPPGTAVVVVDVLSFSTAVSVAVDHGIQVFPFPWRDDRAARFAAEAGAVLAAGRRQAGVSLSPAAIRQWAADPAGAGDQSGAVRLVLPSPNGSSICHAIADRDGPVLAGCLRNAGAVATWLAGALRSGRCPAVAVVAAGERWPDGAIRPAVEDLWGAGAVLARLAELMPGLPFSPEARSAVAAFGSTAAGPAPSGLSEQLADCASGRELIESGFPADVAIAAELDASSLVPVLRAGRFQPADRFRPADR